MFLDSAVWERRWQALEDTMQAIERTLPSDTPRRQTIQKLLQGLHALADDQIQFFLTAQPPAPYSADHALSLTLRQIACDIEAIERAAHQRIAGAPEMREALERADELARQALGLAIGRFLPEITALTYFRRPPAAARALPYAPVALLGIPYTSTRLPRDMLAIPHEAGHFLFWRGVVSDGEDKGLHIYNALRRRLLARAPYHSENSRRWLEEVFADVYGCVIAGPVLALDFQDLQLHHSPLAWTHDDGHHPPPALRPCTHIRVLEKMGLREWAASLHERWQGKLIKAAAIADLPLTEAGMCSQQAELHTIVDVVYELLEDIAADSMHGWPASPQDATYSAVSPYPSNQLDALYDDFEGRLNALPFSGQARDEAQPGGGEADARHLRERFAAEARRIEVALRAAPRQAEAEWLAVLGAEGWIGATHFENTGG
jgi:hypothetical protein